ncbi:hypothetical protein NM688_g7399 [Phlebia brevispora]|uniref:Uncharacterized protein n=1 Tax=Phlebia brevispora TaxID=194682 RepID=A0ACC1S5J1_9APHY|nr:hypothetical protein NM688_g7399 [Phlebia brevispora]
MEGSSAVWSFDETSVLHPLTEEQQQQFEGFKRTHVNLQRLEKEETAIRQRYGLANDVESTQVFKAVEAVANSPNATESNKADLKALTDLRTARGIEANFQHYYRQGQLLESKVLPTVEGSQSYPVHGARCWAVVVGINVYQNSQPLSGACSDAKAMYKYLTVNLSVPRTNIRLLLSDGPPMPKDPHYPSRENILSALFDHLRDNPRVRKGDNIIFYYAGYGANYVSDHTFQCSDDIQALCPADRDQPTPQGRVLDISDRELLAFLEELRDKKGDNVTVIFDCCYSGQATTETALRRARYTAPMKISLKELLDAANNDKRRNPGSQSVFSEHWDWDTSTCVLLTACLASESALENRFEDGWRGFFTRALLALLKRSNRWTYEELCDAVKEYMPRYGNDYTQTPLVVGDRQGCRVWFVPDDQISPPQGARTPSRGLLSLLCPIF